MKNISLSLPPPNKSLISTISRQGELLRGGEIVAKGLPRIVTGDDMGLRADFANGRPLLLTLFASPLSLDGPLRLSV